MLRPRVHERSPHFYSDRAHSNLQVRTYLHDGRVEFHRHVLGLAISVLRHVFILSYTMHRAFQFPGSRSVEVYTSEKQVSPENTRQRTSGDLN